MQDAAPTVLITGANRGLGLEFTRQFAAAGWRVIATARDPAGAAELAALAARQPGIRVEALDVADFTAVDALAARLSGTAIDVLLNNAGILGGGREKQSLGGIDYAAMAQVYRVNAMAPVKMAEAFLPHVAAGTQKKIVSIASGTASLTWTQASDLFTPLYAYRMSKTALNMAMRALAIELAPRGILVGLMAPGMVETRILQDSGYGGRGITPAHSVSGVIRNIANLSAATSGKVIIYTGAEVPW